MDSNRIEELLKKYWECETSLEEEQMLVDYFNSGAVPQQFKETSVLFQYFQHQKKKSLSDSFDGYSVTKTEEKKKNRQSSWVYNSLRIAAGIAVLMIAIWFVRSEIRKTIPQEMVDTYDDPQLAFEETKKALLIISKGFGTAEEQAKKINLFNEAQQQIEGKSNEENK